MQMKTKLWVGIGLCVTLGGAPLAVQAQDAHAGHQGHGAPATAAEGGEGGELGAFSDLSEDQQLMGSLGLIRGHLHVGRELYTGGQASAAVPHFLHPAEEIYEVARPTLEARKVGFDKQLDDLVSLARKNAPVADVAKALDNVEAALNKAEKTIAKGEVNKPSFLVPVITQLLRTASDEYAAGFEDGRIVSPVEYQDGRGFYTIAKAYLKLLSPSIATQDPKGNSAAAMDRLGPVWATLVPPTGPATPPGEVSALVSNVELAINRLR
jgi:hypothetical protein